MLCLLFFYLMFNISTICSRSVKETNWRTKQIVLIFLIFLFLSKLIKIPSTINNFQSIIDNESKQVKKDIDYKHLNSKVINVLTCKRGRHKTEYSPIATLISNPATTDPSCFHVWSSPRVSGRRQPGPLLGLRGAESCPARGFGSPSGPALSGRLVTALTPALDKSFPEENTCLRQWARYLF